jgi:hypothetical protein
VIVTFESRGCKKEIGEPRLHELALRARSARQLRCLPTLVEAVDCGPRAEVREAVVCSDDEMAFLNFHATGSGYKCGESR